MIRSARASRARPSAAVKYSQGPGVAGIGGLPALGTQGRWPAIVSERPIDAPTSITALPAANTSRRLSFPGLRESSSTALPPRHSQARSVKHETSLRSLGPWCQSIPGCREPKSLPTSNRRGTRRLMRCVLVEVHTGGSFVMTHNAQHKSRTATPLRGALVTPTDLSPQATRDISGAMNAILADVFSLYLKAKNFHWHLSGPHFRDYHLLFDEQAAEIYATTDELAERVRKLGARTVHSISEISKLQTIKDNNKDFVSPADMLAELM